MLQQSDNIPVYYTYTRFGQLESKSLGSPFPLSDNSKAVPMAYIKYFYSPDGQITARDVSGNKQNYQYDLKGQLLAVVDATGKAVEQYVYDPAGNILKKTIDGKTTTFKYDRANQLVSSTDASGKVTKYDYDAAGRLTQEGDKSFAYGWLDKVMSVSDNGKLAASFDYGVDGQLASRTDAAGKSESFTWDGLALVKRDSTNFVNESAITGGNPILAFGKDSSKVLFEDMLGSTVGSTEGGKFNAINRTSFGELESGDSGVDFFTGKPQVEGLGYAFLFRNYRADQGKWQTSDPLGYPDGLNNLAYVNNRVTMYIDWQGAEWVFVSGDAYPQGTYTVQGQQYSAGQNVTYDYYRDDVLHQISTNITNRTESFTGTPTPGDTNTVTLTYSITETLITIHMGHTWIGGVWVEVTRITGQPTTITVTITRNYIWE
jgi:RHS repeat-associated protein